ATESEIAIVAGHRLREHPAAAETQLDNGVVNRGAAGGAHLAANRAALRLGGSHQNKHERQRHKSCPPIDHRAPPYWPRLYQHLRFHGTTMHGGGGFSRRATVTNRFLRLTPWPAAQ